MYQTIITPTDGQLLAERALSYATILAGRVGARIVLVRAVPPINVVRQSNGNADRQVDLVELAIRDLRRSVGELRASGRQAEMRVELGDPGDVIVDAVRHEAADIIVMSIHGRAGIGQLHRKSVLDQILRRARLPVAVIPATCDRAHWFADTVTPAGGVLITLDGSALAEAIIPAACRFAEALGTGLSLLRVVDSTEPRTDTPDLPARAPVDVEVTTATDYLDRIAKQLRESGRSVETSVMTGYPPAVIAHASAQPGVLAVALATHGHHGLDDRPMGSTAAMATYRGPVPLLMVRPDGIRRHALGSADALVSEVLGGA